jgi:hypothetical protein
MAGELETQGFAVWKGLLPEVVIDEHVTAFQKFHEALGLEVDVDLAGASPEKRLEIRKVRHQFHWDNQAAHSLIFNPDLIAFLTWLFGDVPVVRQPVSGFYQRGARAHIESPDLTMEPPHGHVRIWCALEDINPAAGPAYFVAQSHQLISRHLAVDSIRDHPEFLKLLRQQTRATTYAQFIAATQVMWHYVNREMIECGVVRLGLHSVSPPLQKGDVVLFYPNLVHGTGSCQDKRLTRKYLFADWAAKNACWYHARAYWGPEHDFRCQENAITAPVAETHLGWRMHFHDFYTSFVQSFRRPVYTHRRIT